MENFIEKCYNKTKKRLTALLCLGQFLFCYEAVVNNISTVSFIIGCKVTNDETNPDKKKYNYKGNDFVFHYLINNSII